jgi:hypothetical protein
LELQTLRIGSEVYLITPIRDIRTTGGIPILSESVQMAESIAIVASVRRLDGRDLRS